MDDTEEVDEEVPEEDTLKSLACLLGKVEGCSVSISRLLQTLMVLRCYNRSSDFRFPKKI